MSESLSNMKYSSLGKKIDQHVSFDKICPIYTQLPLPSHDLTTEVISSKDEPFIQEFVSKWLGNQLICGKYWVYDTHNKKTPFFGDLMPDFMISKIKTDTLRGEFEVTFLLDVKKGTSKNIGTTENLGQAAAYCIRLLEISAPTRRVSVSCAITNLLEGIIVKVSRTDVEGVYTYLRTTNTSAQVLLHMFNADELAHGIFGRQLPITIDNQSIVPVKYLGMGASAVVYSTNEGHAIKFFTDVNTASLKDQECDILNHLNTDKPTDILLQVVVANDSSPVWPFLLISPVGNQITISMCQTHKIADSFVSVLNTVSYAHTRGVIHNDIRPENIITLSDGRWLIIDWAASWDIGTGNSAPTRPYYGCVSYAADSILIALEQQKQGGLENAGGAYQVAASVVTDLISILRSFFVFDHRVSSEALNDLRILRKKEDFIGITEWWGKHLSNDAVEMEAQLCEMFAAQLSLDHMHTAVREYILKRCPKEF